MDLFSEDLFNVFEETEKPVKGKKRKRNEQKAGEDGAGCSDEAKKLKIESTDADTSVAATSANEASAGPSSELKEEKKASDDATAESQESEM